jgi:hypothetical protein
MWTEEFKRNIKAYLLVALIISLLGWSTLASMMLFREKTKVMVIRVNEGGTETIGEDKISDRDHQDLKNFTYFFVRHYFSYDTYNFEDRKSKAIFLSSKEYTKFLFEESLAEAKKIKEEGRIFNQEASIKEIKVINEHVIKVSLQKNITEITETNKEDPVTGEKQRETEYNTVFSELTIKVNPTKRTAQNVYGFEIEDLKEKKRY